MAPDGHATLHDTIDELRLVDSGKAVNSILEKVAAEIREGIRHGHFEVAVSSLRAGGNLEVIVKAGRSYRFLVPAKPVSK